MNYIIGIDPDTRESGVATWDLDKQAFVEIECYDFFDLLDLLVMLKPHIVLVRIEAAWLFKKSNWHKEKGFVGEKIAKSVGANQQVGKLFSEFCEIKRIPFDMILPLGKKNAKEFKIITGWPGKTNSEKRDAGMLVYGIKKITIDK